MSELRKVQIAKEFIVKINGECLTDQSDMEIEEVLDNLHIAIADVIRDYIVEDCKIDVIPMDGKGGKAVDC